MTQKTTGRVLRMVLSIAVVAGGTAAADDPFPVVDGARHAVVVGQSHYLRRVVEACTGVALRQVPEATYHDAEGDYPIYVGDTQKARVRLARQIAELDVEGYIILVEPDCAIVYGGAPRTDSGDPRLWAEGGFCRRFLGADHYFPGELGTVFPKQDRVLVPCGLWVENPAFKHRHWSGYSGAAHSATWRLRASGGGGRFRYHHNLYRVIRPEEHGQNREVFPVIYAHPKQKPKNPLYKDLAPGERYVPAERAAAYWQPCTSSPDVRRLAVEAALAAMDENPGNPAFSLGINDSGGFCVCPACVLATPEGLDPYGRAANARRFFDFYNRVAAEVAEKYPNGRLGFLAYSDLGSAYPADKLHPLLMPYRTLSFADAWDPAYRERLYADMRQWSESAAHFGIYEYYYGMGFLIPRIYLHQAAEGLREAHRLGAEGFYAEAYANWGLDGPKLWVTEKLLWNPNQDVDALIDVWCAGLFAEAAPAMRAYFDYLEEVWVSQQPDGTARGMYRLWGSGYKQQQFSELFTPEACDRAWRLLDDALAKATSDTVKERIAYFRSSFGATRLASKRFHAAVRLDEMAAAERKRRGNPEHRSMAVHEWLRELEQWAAYQDLDSYMDELRQIAPCAFHEFSQEAALNRAGRGAPVRYSFAAWDTDVMAVLFLVDEILKQAMERQPGSKAELDAAMLDLLDAAEARAAAAGGPVRNAASFIRPLCLSMTLDARALANPPRIDGFVEPDIWGAAQFDGNFYRYPFVAASMDETTRFWCGWSGGTLYVAFHCRQPPESVRDALHARDEVELVERRGREYVALGAPFPYLSQVDSVGVSLPDYRIAMVTSAGGIFDGQSTPYGFTTDWDGCTARVARVDDGWCAELAIDAGEEAFSGKDGSGFLRLNFFRTGGAETPNGLRSAWAPAAPRRWAVNPGTSGIVFFSEGGER